MISFILWYVLISLVGWLAVPAAYRLLPNLPDRGFTLARPIGLLLWGYSFWLLASLHIIQNDTGGVLFALFLLAGFSIWLISRHHGWREFLDWLKSKTPGFDIRSCLPVSLRSLGAGSGGQPGYRRD